MADPDLEIKGGGGGEGSLDLLALLAFFPSVISSFFLPKITGGPGRKHSVLSSQFATEYHRHPRALDRPLGAAGILGR